MQRSLIIFFLLLPLLLINYCGKGDQPGWKAAQVEDSAVANGEPRHNLRWILFTGVTLRVVKRHLWDSLGVIDGEEKLSATKF